MARHAEDLLEFDKLLELLRLRTTCAPGRRAVGALRFTEDREALEAAFALIREARAWLRQERELGFGALADPEGWLGRLEGPGAVLEPREFLEVASLLETSSCLRQQFREEGPTTPCWPRRPHPLLTSVRPSRRFVAACCPTERLATTPPLHYAEFV